MRRRISLGLALLVGVGLMLWWLQPTQPVEPSYQGRPLSAWLDDRTPATGLLTAEAEAAVRAIGPAAVPSLMASMSRADSPLVGWSWRVGNFLGTRRFALRSHQAERQAAVLGFRALGPAARSAFPALVNLISHPGDVMQGNDAINALTESDADTMRRLAAGLRDPDAGIRERANFALCCLRIAPDEVCLPALEAASNDPDPVTRQAATKAVAFFLEQMAACARLLTSPNPEIRVAAARIVGGYRARALAFLPNLEAARNDTDPAVRAAADQAIARVRGK